MTDSRFDAEGFNGTKLDPVSGRFHITFLDATGNRQIVSLPAPIALALQSPLTELGDQVKLADQNIPTAAINLKQWKVYKSLELNSIVIWLNNHAPIGIPLAEAKKLWRRMRDECDEVERRPAPRSN